MSLNQKCFVSCSKCFGFWSISDLGPCSFGFVCFLFFFFFFETGSCLSQADLEDNLELLLPHLYLLSSGVVDVCHHILIILILYFQMKDV